MFDNISVSYGDESMTDEFGHDLGFLEEFNTDETPYKEVFGHRGFKEHASGKFTGSSFLINVSDWRTRAASNVILDDEFEGCNPENVMGDLTTAEVLFKIVDRMKELIKEGYLLASGISFGKDSSVLLVLKMIAYAELRNEGFKPKHRGLIMHSDTGVESPEVSNLAIEQWDDLIETIAELQLPLDMRLAQPTFSSSFLGRIVSGRGLPTTFVSSHRECSSDWKVRPNQALLKRYIKKAKRKDPNLKVCLMLGSRDEEGSIRAASIAKHGGQDDPLAVTYVEKTDQYMCYPIKDLKVETIWEVLTLAGKNRSKVIPSMVDFDRTIRVYADSQGECVMLDTGVKSAESSKACGARHGCWTCTAVKEDKSMNEMLKKEEYSYLKILSRIRNYIMKVHFDWSKRTLWNRGIDKYGYTKIQPELYSFEVCRTILHAMITADCIEKERAYNVSLQLVEGTIEDNETNRRMSEVQFQYVTREDIVRLDFLWSFHNFSTQPFEAAYLWNEVYEKGNEETLEWVEDLEAAVKTPQPKPQFIFVGNDWSDGGLNMGFRDIIGEMVAWDTESANVKTYYRKGKDGETHAYQAANYEAAKSIEASPLWAYLYTKDDSEWARERKYMPTQAAMKLVRQGAVKLANGRIGAYQEMCQRYQWWAYRKMVGDCTLAEFEERKPLIEERAETKILSAAEYRAEIKILLDKTGEEFDESVLLPEKILKEFSHYQSNLFDDEDDVVTFVPAKKPRKVNVPKLKVKTIEEQFSLF
ncbi:hypothetical protein [Vibrio barjaei]|uniref:hypothetical protein n=1 Tax=Vibrio barjaei TaxID=1676683 RepID=UPI0022836CE0|nr:hypothetical protein [Vibrio barjaei]MCY9870403.1 hypothetical protein [Vibrio barjaei]